MQRQQQRDQFLEQRVTTATPNQLIKMLLSRAVVELELVAQDAEQGDALALSRLIRVQQIITELRCSLNFDAGGELAKNLDAIYGWVFMCVVQASIDQDPAGLVPATAALADIRDGWVAACCSPAAVG